MTHYKTKLEAYEQGHIKGWQEGLAQGIKEGIAQERARAKKKLDPHYNRKLSLKERVDREAELDALYEIPVAEWKGKGVLSQPSLWQRLTRPIIRELKGFFRP